LGSKPALPDIQIRVRIATEEGSEHGTPNLNLEYQKIRRILMMKLLGAH